MLKLFVLWLALLLSIAWIQSTLSQIIHVFKGNKVPKTYEEIHLVLVVGITTLWVWFYYLTH